MICMLMKILKKLNLFSRQTSVSVSIIQSVMCSAESILLM